MRKEKGRHFFTKCLPTVGAVFMLGDLHPPDHRCALKSWLWNISKIPYSWTGGSCNRAATPFLYTGRLPFQYSNALPLYQLLIIYYIALDLFLDEGGTVACKHVADDHVSQAVQLADIAAELGFYDAHHFSARFQKVQGCRPSVFRREFRRQDGT